MELFSREQTRGLLYLVPILVLILMLTFVIERRQSHGEVEFGDSAEREAFEKGAEEQVSLSKFNPNTYSYEELRAAGLPTDIAVGIVRWRNYGKIYRIKEDLAEVSGMTDSIYAAIKPYIVIEEQYRLPSRKTFAEPRSGKRNFSDNGNLKTSRVFADEPFCIDTASVEYLMRWGLSERQAEVVVRYRDSSGGIHDEEKLRRCYVIDSVVADRMMRHIKFSSKAEKESDDKIVFAQKENHKIEINKADSAQLVSIYGIGAKSAAEIIKYRELLGGFYSLEQLGELKMITESNFERILQQISCDSCEIRKIDINFAGPKSLSMHPYVSDRALRRIVKLRQLKGGWSKIEEMIDDKIFSEEEAERLAPYLRFRLSATE